MRTLVTGATGFTGGHLARALARRGESVAALVRAESPAAAALAGAGIAIVHGDVRDAKALAAATEGVEVANMAAAEVSYPGFEADLISLQHGHPLGDPIH